MNIVSRHKSMILNLIRLFSPISRAELAERIELSITAVSKYVAELIHEGIVEELGLQASQGGRKAALLGIRNEYGCTLSIDFGHTYIRMAFMDMRSNVIVKKVFFTRDLGNYEEGIAQFILLIRGFIAEHQPVLPLLAIGFSLSTLMDDAENTVLFPNLEGWKTVDIVGPVRRSFTVPVFDDDSSRMMALAESVVPGNGRVEQLVFVSVGDGIGTGIVLNGRPVRGARGAAGELAHVIVHENGYPCDCGSSGCLEQYTSVFAMVRSAKQAIKSGVNSKILEYADGDLDKVDSWCISKAYAQDDKLAMTILSDACNYLGVGAAILINLFNTPTLVFGGGGMNLSPNMLEDIARATRLRALTNSMRITDIRHSLLGEDSGLIGASIFALDNLFGFDELCRSHEFYISTSN